MQIQKSFKGQSPYGKLYLVATPIGNLDDMTFRAIQTLKEVDWIAAEDTRNTGLLLKHFDISTKQISFHEHNAKEKIPDLIGFLKAGQSIAQVSDAGLPSISDPGHDLVKAAIEEEIAVVTVPGASAGISALMGITEPALYGITLQHKRAMLGVVFSSAISGTFLGLFAVKGFVIVGPGLASMSMFIDPNNGNNLIFASIGF
ncbi:MAG: SAM-dependent methyltransferase, partial [Streptococcus mitis]|nr:SAM-dependent methyltransferase [Streptococcus mitis]